MMKRQPAAKTGGKKPVGKKKTAADFSKEKKSKRGGKMPPELLERFKGKAGAKKDGNTAGMKKKGGLPAGKAGAKAEAKGEKRGADKKKGATRGSGMLGAKGMKPPASAAEKKKRMARRRARRAAKK